MKNISIEMLECSKSSVLIDVSLLACYVSKQYCHVKKEIAYKYEGGCGPVSVHNNFKQRNAEIAEGPESKMVQRRSGIQKGNKFRAAYSDTPHVIQGDNIPHL
uniref:Uncharacterized protein n=1 Tax=Sphaerodactylus townsendi TaxID=933632 RepID=A0ACB8EGW9_9SAUR